LAIGELCWHLSGNTAASALAYYAPSWSSFAAPDGEIRGSCYGHRIFSRQSGECAWDQVKGLLRRDPHSRRAVLFFNEEFDHLSASCHDAACATTLQFLIREGVLDAVLTMRSNDVVWGMPYDVFLFTFLQELMAAELGVGLGVYHHFACSMHIYERHVALARRVLSSHPNEVAMAMPQLRCIEKIQEFCSLERRLREGAVVDAHNLPSYWRELAEVLVAFAKERRSWKDRLTTTTPTNPYAAMFLQSVLTSTRERCQRQQN
jgi:thymidylate synthase